MSDESGDGPGPVPEREVDTLDALWPDPGTRSRNLDIIAAKHRGMSYRVCANTFQISEGHVKRLVRQWRAFQPTLRTRGATEILDEILEAHQAAIEELALLGTTAKQEAVRVGAIKAKLEALRTVTEILQATGNLPHDLGQLRLQLDVQAVTARFLAVFDEFKVSDEVADALLAALEGRDDGGRVVSIGQG